VSSSKCQIVRTLGVGGMATVYLADLEENGTTRRVAVKKPHAFLAEDPATLAVLEDEAQLGACIRHPNVVRVLDLVRGAEPALVLELVEGVDLAALVRKAVASGVRLPLDVSAAIVRDVLAGLHAAHEARRADGSALDVVHRDVSPQNVLVGFDGVVRIADFGVAKAAWRQQFTEQGSVKGKLGYLAPEQLSGRCDRRADLFSAGVVLWELLTGERFRTGEGVEMLAGILGGQATAPSRVVADAAPLDAVVLRALERSADDRFATAATMAAAIEDAVSVASPERVAAVVHALVAPSERGASEASAAASAVTVTTRASAAPSAGVTTRAGAARSTGVTTRIACAPPTAVARCVRERDRDRLRDVRVSSPPPGAAYRGAGPLAEPLRRSLRSPRRAA
jgi:eukaryotic-like serine/threonine-protein kinase